LIPIAGAHVPVPGDPNPTTIPNAVVVRRDVNALHHLFGHANLDSIRRTATYYGIKWVGEMNPCADCALARIKQKSVPKTTSSHGNSPGYCLFVDISSSLDPSYGGSRYWVLIVDDFSCSIGVISYEPSLALVQLWLSSFNC
jgi:hypothetical protein